MGRVSVDRSLNFRSKIGSSRSRAFEIWGRSSVPPMTEALCADSLYTRVSGDTLSEVGVPGTPRIGVRCAATATAT